MNLKNKTVVITGGATGLGLSLVKKLIAEDCLVHIISRNESHLQDAVDLIKSPLLKTHIGDVTSYDLMKNLIDEIGEVDILINNAGIWIEGQLVENEIDKIANTIDVNLKGMIFTTKAVLPKMLKNDDGHIFNIISTSGLVGRKDQSVYVASKYGATGFTKSLQEDLASTNIKVTAFFPGGMKTELFSKAGFPKENQDWMDPDKIAEIIIFMLEQDDSLIMDHVVVNKRKTKFSN